MRGRWLRRILLFTLVWLIIVEGRLDSWPLALVGIGAATAASSAGDAGRFWQRANRPQRMDFNPCRRLAALSRN